MSASSSRSGGLGAFGVGPSFGFVDVGLELVDPLPVLALGAGVECGSEVVGGCLLCAVEVGGTDLDTGDLEESCDLFESGDVGQRGGLGAGPDPPYVALVFEPAVTR